MGCARRWARRNQLRRRAIGNDDVVDLRMFHGRLLGAGSVALPLVIQRQFGAAAWEQIRTVVELQNTA